MAVAMNMGRRTCSKRQQSKLHCWIQCMCTKPKVLITCWESSTVKIQI